VTPATAQKALNGTGTATFTINGDHFYQDGGGQQPTVTFHPSGSPDTTGDFAATVNTVNTTAVSCTFDLLGKAEGQWDITVTNPDGQAVTLAKAFAIQPAGLTAVALQTDRPDPQPYGSTITLSAKKTGTATNIEYAFFAKYINAANQQWVEIPLGYNQVSGTNYSTNASFVWKPSIPANYYLYVKARIVGSTVDQVVSPETFYRVADGSIASATCTVTNKLAINGTYQLVGATTGTAVNVEYKFAGYKKDPTTGKLVYFDIRGYQSANSVNWAPLSNGDYYLGVLARVVGSTASYDKQSSFTYYKITGVQ
jgi:hypothetical protein